MKNFSRLIPVLDCCNILLQGLGVKANEQKGCLEAIKLVLPHDLQSHVLHCVASAKTLTVFTPSASWATSLRFYSKDMLAAVNGRVEYNLSTMRVKILPDVTFQKAEHKPVIPTQETVSVLMSQCQTITDPKLKASLMRLSSTLMRLQQENTKTNL